MMINKLNAIFLYQRLAMEQIVEQSFSSLVTRISLDESPSSNRPKLKRNRSMKFSIENQSVVFSGKSLREHR